MGIPCYFSKLIKKYPKILNKYDNLEIYHFYLDCNSIIYDVVNSIEEKTDENIINNVIYKLEEYINTIQAKSSVFIAFDGVAPNAKLHQQRERRYKSYITNKTFSVSKWNTCQITPGTPFMKTLMSEIESHFKDKPKVTVSSSNVPGEGEHKIFDKIREFNNDKTSMVYGIDADLIMLCLSNKRYCEKLILFRETPFFIKNINRNIEPNELYYIDICELSKAIDITLNKKNSELDYILLMFFLGNDFLPHFPALDIRGPGMDILIEGYNHCSENNELFSLINDNNINWNHLNILLEHLSQEEKSHIIDHQEKKQRFKRYSNSSNETELQNKYLNIPTQLRNTEYCIDAKKEGWEKRYYSLLLDIEKDSSNFFINKLCHNFYKTLQWTYKYYTSGCIDWTWTFDYSYPPLLVDLVKKPTNGDFEFKKNTKAIEPSKQLFYVLPPDCLSLLDKKQQKIKKEEFNKMTITYEWCYCKYIWEGHINFII
jgi:5'-3' exoribonuclease 1